MMAEQNPAREVAGFWNDLKRTLLSIKDMFKQEQQNLKLPPETVDVLLHKKAIAAQLSREYKTIIFLLNTQVILMAIVIVLSVSRDIGGTIQLILNSAKSLGFIITLVITLILAWTFGQKQDYLKKKYDLE